MFELLAFDLKSVADTLKNRIFHLFPALSAAIAINSVGNIEIEREGERMRNRAMKEIK